MTAADDDRQVLDELTAAPTTPVSAFELAMRLRLSERRVSSSLGRLRRKRRVTRERAVCPHCRGNSTLTTWKPATPASGLLERPSVVGMSEDAATELEGSAELIRTAAGLVDDLRRLAPGIDPAPLARSVLADPYPPDVFTDLSEDDYSAIHAALSSCPVPNACDRLHASWARRLYSNYEHYRNEAD